MTARITERLSELVSTPSVTGYEAEAADLVAGWLEEGGVTADRWSVPMAELETDPEYPGREVEREWAHVAAGQIEGSRPGPTVVLTGHIDTVAPSDLWTLDPLAATLRGDRLHGLGACDMKAGVVAALEAFLAFTTRDFAGTLRFAAVSGEEDGGTGTLAAIRRGYCGDYVLLAEPTSGPRGPEIVVAHGGALTYSITVTGRSAHGATPGEGESALDHFWTIYRSLRDLEQEVNAAEGNELMRAIGVPYATNVGIIRGGTWASNVMESLTAELRVGVALHETIEQAERRFTATLREAISCDPWLSLHPPRVERTGAAFGSSSIDPNHPLVTTVADAAEALTGKRPGLAGKPYGCDMALWTRVGGAATLVYGPGDVAAAHAPDEWVSVAETARVTEVLIEATHRLLIPRH